MTVTKQEALALLDSMRREFHFTLDDDPWYSCPKSGRCANDKRANDPCDCGFDAHNATVEKLRAYLSGAPALHAPPREPETGGEFISADNLRALFAPPGPPTSYGEQAEAWIAGNIPDAPEVDGPTHYEEDAMRAAILRFARFLDARSLEQAR